MPTPSLAEEVLRTLERAQTLIAAIYVAGGHKGTLSLQELMRDLGALEAMALRRADASAAEAHRRIMESCHVYLPEQARLA